MIYVMKKGMYVEFEFVRGVEEIGSNRRWVKD